MSQVLVRAAAAVLAVGVGSCGGSGSSPTTAPSATSPITRGIVLVSQTSDGLYGLMPSGLWRIKIPVEVRAINDIPLNLNYARLTFYDRTDAEILRVEVSANDIVAQAGSNHVTRDRSLAFTLVFEYTPRSFDHVTLFLNATDANGNSIDATLTNLRYVPDPELQ